MRFSGTCEHCGTEYEFKTKKRPDFKAVQCFKCKKDSENWKQIKHPCKYCGQETGSSDRDVLCAECRDTFGHTFYSEL